MHSLLLVLIIIIIIVINIIRKAKFILP